MSENLHPHDEQWDDMPLPNEEEAWQKMQLLLEKEDQQRRLLPFWFWRFGLAGLLLLGAATGGYFLLNRDDNKQAEIRQDKETSQPQQRREQVVVTTKERTKELLQQSPVLQKEALNKETVFSNPSTTAEVKKEFTKNNIALQQTENNTEENSSGKKQLLRRKQSPRRNVSPVINNMAIKESSPARVPKALQPLISSGNNDSEKSRDSVTQVATGAKKDSISTKDSAKVVAAPPVVSNETEKKATKKKNRILLSAGVGLQQAIAFNGQHSSSYNLNGKRNRLSDHIPSIYLRLQKEKWFLQGELHYNVPQPVKPVSFHQTSSYNGFSAMLKTERVSLQKLYYHQLPFSINYFVLPNWSWGAGAAYNLLAGAVTEEETENKNITTGSETILTRIVPVKGFQDSFLYRSTTAVLLQTDYHWKRVSFGLRYIKNLEPFIKYTQPDGTVMNEKNQVLQAVLRFRIM